MMWRFETSGRKWQVSGLSEILKLQELKIVGGSSSYFISIKF